MLFAERFNHGIYQKGFLDPGFIGKPIIPIAGEINLVTPQEIADYGAELTKRNVMEANFYADETDVKPAVLAAIKAL
jgi:hypothetical protein